MVALAPSDPRNGPLMLRPPSYAISANRFTMPMMRTNRKASFASCFESAFDILSANNYRIQKFQGATRETVGQHEGSIFIKELPRFDCKIPQRSSNRACVRAKH